MLSVSVIYIPTDLFPFKLCNSNVYSNTKCFSNYVPVRIKRFTQIINNSKCTCNDLWLVLFIFFFFSCIYVENQNSITMPQYLEYKVLEWMSTCLAYCHSTEDSTIQKGRMKISSTKRNKRLIYAWTPFHSWFCKEEQGLVWYYT